MNSKIVIVTGIILLFVIVSFSISMTPVLAQLIEPSVLIEINIQSFNPNRGTALIPVVLDNIIPTDLGVIEFYANRGAVNLITPSLPLP